MPAMSTLTCPECGAPMRLLETPKFKDNLGRPKKFYGCTNYPECKGTHGAHPDGRPLGTPADAETKQARRYAHDAFDAHCIKYDLTADEGYSWLAGVLGVPEDEAHMGQMDKETCEAVVGLCSQGRAI